MRILAVPALVVLLATGCGGSKKPTFRNGDFATLAAHPAKYAGATVDFTGQVQQVVYGEDQTEWLLVYADPKHAAEATLVSLADVRSAVKERQLVHVTGTVRTDLDVPFELSGGYGGAPVVLAKTATAG